MYCIGHIQNSDIQHSIFSGVCQHIQSYSALLKHIHAYWDIIKAYLCSAFCITLIYSKLFHILSPSIFRTGHLKSCETLIIDIGLFRHIQNLVQRFHTQKPSILRIQNPSIIATPHLFRSLSYLQKFKNIQSYEMFKTPHIFRTLSKILRWSFLQKNYNYFFNLRSFNLRFFQF